MLTIDRVILESKFNPAPVKLKLGENFLNYNELRTALLAEMGNRFEVDKIKKANMAIVFQKAAGKTDAVKIATIYWNEG